jgi:predicted dehydrogenase
MLRRDFIKSSTIAASAAISPISLRSNVKKIKLAILGTGGWGTGVLLTNVLTMDKFEIVGLCDVNTVALNKAAEVVKNSGKPSPKLFSSYKDLYELPGLQAVAIATPTHWHALQFIDACKKGIHVFLEKPISYDLREAQAMMEAYKNSGIVVQVDFPRVMVDTNDEVKAYINSGELGKIYQVQANINGGGVSNLVEKPIPETMDFDTYCGPAPFQKYLCKLKSEKPNWRSLHAFSRGILFDLGIHYIHNVREIMDLDLPDNVSAIGGTTRNFSNENPDHLDVRFDFDGLPVYWTHKRWGYTSPISDHDIGVYYFGEKGTLFAGDLGWEIFPKGGGEKIAHGNVRFRYRDEVNFKIYQKMFFDMFSEFAEGIQNGSNAKITNTFEKAFKTTNTVNYGDLAFRSKSIIEIDKLSLNIKNNNIAQEMLKRDYRPPYIHPYDT